MTRRDWWPMLLAMLPLMGWWSTGLFDLDEGFYGAITAEMNRRGEWITPYFAGRPWFEKPILLYWLAKPCLWLLGPDVGPRLPSVLMSIATLGMTYAFARHQRDARTAELAVLILGGSLLFAGPGRMMLTDPTLVACLTAMVYAMWLAETDARWRPIAGAALGLSILAKGPVGVLLLIPWLAYLAWRDPQFRIGLANGRAIGWIGFALAASAVTASWYLPAYLANGDAFVQGFLVEQNLRRFTGGDEAHTWRNPLNYLFFVPIFLLGMLPFSLHISAAVRQAKSDRFLRAMLAWAVVVFLFFTVSGAKLIHYIMPMFPPLAIVMASALRDRSWARPLAIGTCIAMTILTNLGFPAIAQQLGQTEAHALIRTVNGRPEPVALYQIGRRERDRGTGGTQLRETSLPSLRLYLDRDARDVESPAELARGPIPVLIFTRVGRLTQEDAAQFARKSLALRPLMKRNHFEVFQLEKTD